MQGNHIIGIVEAAFDLSNTTEEALRSIARAAAGVIARGPIAVAEFDSEASGASRVCFERADDRYVTSFAEWQREAPRDIHRRARSLAPRAVQFRTELCGQLPPGLQTLAQDVFPLCLLANTGDGGGLHVAFGTPESGEWRPARWSSFHEIAAHLAAAWRLRKALCAAMAPTAADTLRGAVVAHDRACAVRPAACAQELWPSLIAGRWSLLDTFTAGGTRYIVAHQNPAGCETLRALSTRERSTLELALVGRSGKWIAAEMQLSESVVTRTLHAALRKLGVTDAAALSGVRTAWFEPLEGLDAGVDLAIARLMPDAGIRANLSDAERAIVDGLLGGKRIAVIARERGTSPRTVAHQITSTYQKLGVSSRRELLALSI